jgi:hypothetical protein
VFYKDYYLRGLFLAVFFIASVLSLESSIAPEASFAPSAPAGCCFY